MQRVRGHTLASRLCLISLHRSPSRWKCAHMGPMVAVRAWSSWKDSVSKTSHVELARQQHAEKAKLLAEQQHARQHPSGLTGVEAQIRALQEEVNSLFARGEIEKALEVGIICKETILSHFGEEHPVFASAMNNLGMIYKNMGKWDEAIEAYAKAVQVYKESLGARHQNTAIAMENHAHTLKTMAGFKKGMEKHLLVKNAEDLFEEVLKIKVIALGRQNVQVGMTMQSLGAVLRQRGQIDRGSKLVQEGKEIVCSLLPEKTAAVATSYNNFGYDLKTKGELEEAEKNYVKALGIRRQLLGETHSDTIVVMNNLAELYLLKGDEAAASTLQKKILDAYDIEVQSDDSKEYRG